MIVFTITHQTKDIIWVTSTRTTPEERWEQLINQAQEMAQTGLHLEGIFRQIDEDGVDSFTLNEWGFGENPTEIKQLMREAQMELGAQPLITGKMDHSQSPRKKLSDRQAMDLLNSIEAKLDLPKTDKLPPSSSLSATRPKVTENKSLAKESSPQISQKLPTGRVSSAIKEKKIREAIEEEKAKRAATKSAEIARSAREMNHVIASIENRRLQMRDERAAKIQEERKRKQAALKKSQKEILSSSATTKPTTTERLVSLAKEKTNQSSVEAVFATGHNRKSNFENVTKPSSNVMPLSNHAEPVIPAQKEVPLSREEAIAAAKLLARLMRAKHARRLGSELKTG
jgi:colicin import membrane protein